MELMSEVQSMPEASPDRTVPVLEVVEAMAIDS
jgi:hypothetical protein